MFGGGSTFHLDVSPDIQAATPLLRGYDDDYLQVGQTRYPHGLSIHQGELISPWGPERFSDLAIQHIEHILHQPPEVFILGTGRTTQFPNETLMHALVEAHIGFECMDSRAAARTYNILVGEGRKTSAIFFLPKVRR